MTEKKCRPETDFGKDVSIGRGSQTLLEAIRGDSARGKKSVLLLLQHQGLGSDKESARALLAKLLEDMASSVNIPNDIVLADSAVLLACAGEAALGSLCRLEAMGTQISVCRRSAEEYLADARLCCGEPVSTVEMWMLLATADKVISL